MIYKNEPTKINNVKVPTQRFGTWEFRGVKRIKPLSRS